MRIRELSGEDVRDAVRILLLSFSRELNGIFGDTELARELLFKFFSNHMAECLVAESDRIVGFASYSFEHNLPLDFFRRELGFVRGLKTSLLIRYLCPKAKGKRATLNFLAVSPLRRNSGVGSALMKEIVDRLEGRARVMECNVSIDNDAGIALLTKFGFEVVKMIENNFSEKYFGVRQWYRMRLYLQ